MFSVSGMLDFKRRRTERIRKERIDSTIANDSENTRRPRTNSQSDPTRRGRGRPKTVGQKKQEEEKGKNNMKFEPFRLLEIHEGTRVQRVKK